MEHYSTIKNTNEHVVHIWLVNYYGEVFIHNIDINRKKIHINEITIVTKNLKSALEFAKAKWSVRTDMLAIEEIYSYESDKYKNIIRGYVLTQNTESTKSMNCSGSFISFHELDDYFKRFKLNIDFKEAFYSLLAYLDKKYGYKKLPVFIY